MKANCPRFSRNFLSVLSVSLVFAATACGSPGEPQTPSASTPKPAATALAAADVSPLAKPADVIVSGRWRKPSQTLGLFQKWTSMQAPPAADIAEFLTNEAVGDLVDMDKPIDLVAGRSKVLLSAAIKNPATAKTALAKSFKLEPAKHGGMHLAPLKPEEDEGDEPRACDLMASADTELRLVCANGQEVVDSFGPYAVRGLARTDVKNDIHIDASVAAVHPMIAGAKPMIGALLSSGSGDVPREMVQAIGNDLFDFAMDVNQISADFDARETDAEVKLAFKFGKTDSNLAKIFTSHPERAATPPPAFLRMPKDAKAGVFWHEADAASLKAMRDAIVHAQGERMKAAGIAEADASAMGNSITTMLSGAPAAMSFGFDAAAVKTTTGKLRELDAKKNAAAYETARAAAIESLTGWWAMATDEPFAKISERYKALSTLTQKPAVQKVIREKGGRDPLLGIPSMRVAAAPAALNLPKGSLVVESENRFPDLSKGKTATRVVKASSVIVADGERTWIVNAANAKLAAKQMTNILGSDENAQLGKRTDLAWIRETKSLAGGFGTPEAFGEWSVMISALTKGSLEGALEFFQALGTTPNQGGVPFQIALTPGGEREVAIRAFVPKGAVEDVATLARPRPRAQIAKP